MKDVRDEKTLSFYFLRSWKETVFIIGSWVPLLKVTTKVNRLFAQDNIFKIPLSGLMIQVFHYALPKYSSMEEKNKATAIHTSFS